MLSKKQKTDTIFQAFLFLFILLTVMSPLLAVGQPTASSGLCHSNTIYAGGFEDEAVSIKLIDEILDASAEDNEDSDNYFLRENNDHQDLAIFYSISADADSIEQVCINIYQGDSDSGEPIASISGERAAANEQFKTGDNLKVHWTAPIDLNEDHPGYYRVQLVVTTTGGSVLTTPVSDADGNPDNGWQSPPDGLVIHDLVWKHRPVVHIGENEVVGPPQHPFNDELIAWMRHKNSVDKTDPDNDISALPEPSYNDFASMAAAGFDYENFLARSNATSNPYIDIHDQHRRAMTAQSVLFHHIAPENNYVFLQYWMYMPSSHGLYNSLGIESNDFTHEGDWEMCQFTIRLKDLNDPDNKTLWLDPFAATASQHFYGQTLLWNKEQNGPETLDQDYVAHDNNGQRVKIYIAENAHAVYFRAGEISGALRGGAGTQIQYDSTSIFSDRISNPRRITPTLLPLSPSWLYRWKGIWGQTNVSSFASFKGSESPEFRYNDIGSLNSSEKIFIATEPAKFHNLNRKQSLAGALQL